MIRLVVAKSVYAKIDRPNKVVNFRESTNEADQLNSWAGDISGLLGAFFMRLKCVFYAVKMRFLNAFFTRFLGWIFCAFVLVLRVMDLAALVEKSCHLIAREEMIAKTKKK